MADLVVTVPKSFGLDRWIDEGDAAGEAWSGELWDFGVAGGKPDIAPGERVYIVYDRKLRGYAPLVALERGGGANYWRLVRGGGAVAVTIDEEIIGFRGWRRRWWDRAVERPFPDWHGGHWLFTTEAGRTYLEQKRAKQKPSHGPSQP
jgi:hypothetical protein